jgi:threonylcarbamoyladenosine tRNA methylthiotransferase MtaB
MRIHFDLVGCRVNEAEIESMAVRAAALGHTAVADPAAADWIVVNTCTVTREAERDSRQKIRRAHACNGAARLAVTGCWSTMEPDRAAALPGVACVIPNAEKENLIAQILGPRDISAAGPAPAPPARRRTRAYIKVQDGCANACAFCSTRLARGPLRSRSADEIVADILAAEQSGAKEAVLAGVHLGAWGKELGIASGRRSWPAPRSRACGSPRSNPGMCVPRCFACGGTSGSARTCICRCNPGPRRRWPA